MTVPILAPCTPSKAKGWLIYLYLRLRRTPPTFLMRAVFTTTCKLMAISILLAIERSPVLPPLMARTDVGYILTVMGQRGCVVAVTVLTPPLCALHRNIDRNVVYVLYLAEDTVDRGRELSSFLCRSKCGTSLFKSYFWPWIISYFSISVKSSSGFWGLYLPANFLSIIRRLAHYRDLC